MGIFFRVVRTGEENGAYRCYLHNLTVLDGLEGGVECILQLILRK